MAKKETEAQRAKRINKLYGEGSAKSNAHFKSMSKEFRERQNDDMMSDHKQSLRTSKKNKSKNAKIFANAGTALNNIADFMLPTSLMWKWDETNAVDKAIDVVTALPMAKLAKLALFGKSTKQVKKAEHLKDVKAKGKAQKKINKADKGLSKAEIKASNKKYKKDIKSAKKGIAKVIPTKSLLLKSFKVGGGTEGMGAESLLVGALGNWYLNKDKGKGGIGKGAGSAGGLIGGGLSGGGSTTSSKRKVSGGVTKKKGKGVPTGVPLSTVKTNALEVGETAKKIGSACCSNNKQEQIKIHAFRSNVETSLADIAKAEESQAEDIDKATKKKQNDPRSKTILQTLKGLKSAVDSKMTLKNLGKAVKFGIYGWLGTLGVLSLIGFLEKMGGWFGLKKWFAEAVVEQVEEMMNGLKQWWDDTVLENIRLIFANLSVQLGKFGMGDTMSEVAQKIQNAKSTSKPAPKPAGVKRAPKATPKAKPAPKRASFQQGKPITGPKLARGHRQIINTRVKASWYKRTTSDYGMRKRNGRESMHGGVDIRAKVGTPLTALDGGIVTVADNNPKGREGRMVSIYNPRTKKRMQYLHLSKIDPLIQKAYASRNSDNPIMIKAGDPIGLSGKSGSGNMAPHLHLQVKSGKSGGKTVDPMKYVESVTAHNDGVKAKSGGGTQVTSTAKKTQTKVAPVASASLDSSGISNETFMASLKRQDAINSQMMELAIKAGQEKSTSVNSSFHNLA